MFARFTLWFLSLSTALRREEGQTMAEYGVILSVITVVVLGALVVLAGNMTGVIEAIARTIVV